LSQEDLFWAQARKALTPGQLAVVQQLGKGPVKVEAAAGSGKTTTMAWLYAAALVSGSPVGRIMAVTFTERAAAELRQKVSSVMSELAIGPEGGSGQALEGAWIGTFHQLVRRLLGERSYLAGLPRDLELIDEVAAAMLMEETVTSVRGRAAEADSWAATLPAAPDPRTLVAVVGGAAQVVGRLRSTELTPNECERESLAAYRAAAELGDPTQEIDWHRAALRVTTTIWREYEQRLGRRGALDFDGLLREGLGALRRSPPLLRWCRDNFSLVIVDEYQDTSALQESLIKELTGPEPRGLFMVGDARQSIYAFRDAKPGIMKDAVGRRFELFRNHRSRTTILAAADHVIRADPGFAADQPMEAARGDESPLPVLVAQVDDPAQEAEGIASVLEQLRRQGISYPDQTHDQLAWSDMAVLAYTHGRIGAPLEEALRRRGIPFQTATGGLFDRPEVRDALALLRLADDERDDIACLRLLQCQVGRIPDRALIALGSTGGRRGPGLAAQIRQHLRAGSPGWERPWAERAGRLLAVAQGLGEAARALPAGELLARGLMQSGLIQLHEARVRSGDPRGRRGLASLRELQREAWAAEADGRWLGLSGLLARFAVMRESAKTAEPPAQAGEDLVTLSTIHRAKGLEWKVVVLADCRPFHRRGSDAVIWDRAARAVICSRIGGKPTAARRRWGASPAASLEGDERRRLVYVAMTRARDLLLVTSSRTSSEGEFAQLAAAAAEGVDWALDWPQLGQLGSLPGAVPGARPDSFDDAEPEASTGTFPLSRLRERWEQLGRLAETDESSSPQPSQLSFTAIETLQRCPRQYWYRYLARYPSTGSNPDWPNPMAEAASAGSERARRLGVVVHSVLERLHQAAPGRASSLPEALEVLGLAAAELEPEQLGEAQEMLRNYLALPAAALPTVATELAFVWAEWGQPGWPALVGVIDRIALLPGNGLLILDYKTNLQLDAARLAVYSRQLQLYAAAVGAGAMGAPGASTATALAMLRTGELITVPSGPEERREALHWASTAANRVVSGEYRAGDDFPDRPCRECPYRARCPERRADIGAPLPGEFEQP